MTAVIRFVIGKRNAQLGVEAHREPFRCCPALTKQRRTTMDYTKVSNTELLELLACTGRGSNSEFKIRTEIMRRGLPQPR